MCQQFGSYNPRANECAARLGVSLRQTEDQLTRDMLASTASFINCTAGINGDNPTELTRSDIDDVIRALLGNNAVTLLDHIEGEDKFGTAPTRDASVGWRGTAEQSGSARLLRRAHSIRATTETGVRFHARSPEMIPEPNGWNLP